VLDSSKNNFTLLAIIFTNFYIYAIFQFQTKDEHLILEYRLNSASIMWNYRTRISKRYIKYTFFQAFYARGLKCYRISFFLYCFILILFVESSYYICFAFAFYDTWECFVPLQKEWVSHLNSHKIQSFKGILDLEK
jgi:hypothetical protein